VKGIGTRLWVPRPPQPPPSVLRHEPNVYPVDVEGLLSQWGHMATSHEMQRASPLYQRYAKHVLSIPAHERSWNILFSIFSAVESSKQQPSLLLAAVQDAIWRTRPSDHPLADFYQLPITLLPNKPSGLSLEAFVPIYDQSAPPVEEAAVLLLRFDRDGGRCLVKGVAHPHGRTCSLEMAGEAQFKRRRRRPCLRLREAA
jgi:hypothetical protein